jgi:hypothetical protein
MDRHYVYEHTKQRKGEQDRYDLFNEYERVHKKTKRKDVGGESTTGDDINPIKRRRRERIEMDQGEYVPSVHLSREERAEARGSRGLVPYHITGHDSRNRRVYHFEKIIFKKMYKTIWATKNKIEYLVRLSKWNQVDGRYFWVTYYTANKIIYLALMCFEQKYEKIEKLTKPFIAAFEGDDNNEYLQKFYRNVFKIKDELNKIVNYWMKNKKERLEPIKKEKRDPYVKIFDEFGIIETVKFIKHNYKDRELKEKKKLREKIKQEKLEIKEKAKEEKKNLRVILREKFKEERKLEREVKRKIAKEVKEVEYLKWREEHPLSSKKEFTVWYKEKLKAHKLKPINEKKFQQFMEKNKNLRRDEIEAMAADPNSKYQKYFDRVREFFQNKDKEKMNVIEKRVTRSMTKPQQPIVNERVPKRYKKT